MEKALSTEEIEKRGLPEAGTCSMLCANCRERLWFVGNWGGQFTRDRETIILPTAPDVFSCPSCGLINVNPYLQNRR